MRMSVFIRAREEERQRKIQDDLGEAEYRSVPLVWIAL